MAFFKSICASSCAFVVLFFAAATARAADPTPEQTLAFLKNLDTLYPQPRFKDVTLDSLKTLTDIKLGGHNKTDKKHIHLQPDDFKHLANLPALKKADLMEIDGFTDEALPHIAKCANLTYLEMGDAAITGEGLKHLVPLTNLTFLSLAFARQVDDAGMPHVAKFTKLETLILSGTKITDAGLKQLTPLKNLKELRIGGPMELTDKALEPLKEIPSLTKLILGKKNKITDPALESLKKSLPNLTVERR